MLVDISLEPTAVIWEPANEVEEIVQNVRMILLTPKFTAPLNRAFGVAGSVVDLPIHQAAAFYQQSIVEAVAAYEPRAEVTSVTFGGSEAADGVLRPRVTVKIGLD